MTNSISLFKDNFNGGTRSNRFVVRPVWPQGIFVGANDPKIKIVSASLPVVQINSISIPYRGRLINFAGDRQYSPWVIGIYDDGNAQNLWKAFHKWKELMDGHYTHTVTGNDFNYTRYQTTWEVEHLDVNGENSLNRRISLYKCWPSVVGEINLNMGESNFVAFSVTLTFDNIRIWSV
jgi:hypothetical protein